MRQHAGDVAAGEHRHHPGHAAGGSAIDAPDAGMRMGTPQHAGIEHIREAQVVDEGAAAGHQPGVFEAFQGLAYVTHLVPPALTFPCLPIPLRISVLALWPDNRASAAY
jgi:hypothetical protein